MSSSIEPSDHHSPANISPPLNEKPQVRTAKAGSSYASTIIINSYFKLLCVRVICYTAIRTGTHIPLELLRPVTLKLGEKMLLFYVMQSSKPLGRVWVTVWTSAYMDEILFTKSHQGNGAKGRVSSTADGG